MLIKKMKIFSIILVFLFMCLIYYVNSSNDLVTPLMKAIANGDLELVKKLVEKNRVDINETSLDRSPIALAAWNNNIDIVRYLLSKGAKTDYKETYLEGGRERVRTLDDYLLKCGVDIKDLLEEIRTGQTKKHECVNY